MLSLRQFHKFSKIYTGCRSLTSWQLAFKQHGEPLDVVFERTVDVAPPTGKQVRVNFRAAPINPSDINTAQGTYPNLPKLPGVMGQEGAGYVRAVR